MDSSKNTGRRIVYPEVFFNLSEVQSRAWNSAIATSEFVRLQPWRSPSHRSPKDLCSVTKVSPSIFGKIGQLSGDACVRGHRYEPMVESAYVQITGARCTTGSVLQT